MFRQECPDSTLDRSLPGWRGRRGNRLWRGRGAGITSPSTRSFPGADDGLCFRPQYLFCVLALEFPGQSTISVYGAVAFLPLSAEFVRFVAPKLWLKPG
jgi:hypothetical protein